MIVEGFWATPVYHTILNNNDTSLVQQEFKEVYDNYLSNNIFDKRPGWENRNHSLSDASFKSNFIEEFNLNHFAKIVETNLKHFMYNINQPTDFKYKLFESWMTLTKPGEFAIPHSHVPAHISGVYYYQTNEIDGDITFLPPFAQADWMSGELPTTFSYKPKKGLLLLFPGWLLHYVKTNETSNDRVSISFNIKFIKGS